MRERGISQRELADVMGVDLSRVKNLCAGRLKKLTREEGEALIRKLHVRAHWLATGEGPMFESESERAFTSRIDKLGPVSKIAAKFGLSESEAHLLTEILFYTETGNVQRLRETMSKFAELSPKESALLNYYRSSSEEARDALMKMGSVAAQSKNKISKKTRRSS